MYLLCFAVAVFSCILGKLCGMGGGIIIKPVVDAMGILPVAAVNFLSTCTVVGMSSWSVGRSMMKGEQKFDTDTTLPLAIGAGLGGLLGKSAFSRVAAMFPNPDSAGFVQAALLLAACLVTLVFTIRQDKIRCHHFSGFLPCSLLGLLLGLLCSFLGVGGGPFNMAAFAFFFSLPPKKAAQNSLCVVLVSQTLSLIKTLINGAPQLPLLLLFGMVACGILGSQIGANINKRISDEQLNSLFKCTMILVMAISAYNIYRLY